MGLRIEGLVAASTLPLLLTMILFLGPLSVQLTHGIWKIYSGLCFFSMKQIFAVFSYQIFIFRTWFLVKQLPELALAS